MEDAHIAEAVGSSGAYLFGVLDGGWLGRGPAAAGRVYQPRGESLLEPPHQAGGT